MFLSKSMVVQKLVKICQDGLWQLARGYSYGNSGLSSWLGSGDRA